MTTFGGDTFSEKLDGDRLRRQLYAVRKAMFDNRWRTLKQLSDEVGAPEASVSARLRDLRKKKFGGYIVERQRIPNGNGLHIYRVPRQPRSAR
jgi:DNA-binding Lrp family transcriptional regulator